MQQIDIYTDESGSIDDSHQAVTLISGSVKTMHFLATELVRLKEKYDISEEIKSTKIRTKEQFTDCAEEWIKLLLSCAMTDQIHIWAFASSKATRYSFDKRFLKGLHTLNSLYEGEVVYSIIPDQNTAIPRDEHGQRRSQVLPLKEIRQVKSHQEPIIQLCDLISGLLRWGLIHYEDYVTYRTQQKEQTFADHELQKLGLLRLLENTTTKEWSRWTEKSILVFH